METGNLSNLSRFGVEDKSVLGDQTRGEHIGLKPDAGEQAGYDDGLNQSNGGQHGEEGTE